MFRIALHDAGGGTGLNSRSYGLACDQIVGLTMVNSQGVALEANATQNADLLWASCGGGGGNLGIVTSFSVNVNSVPPQVTTIQLNWAGYDQAAAVFDLVLPLPPSHQPAWRNAEIPYIVLHCSIS